MKKIRLIFCLFISLAIPATFVSAAVVVSPTLGGDYYFEWLDGLGKIDGIEPVGNGAFLAESEWSLTVAADSILDSIIVSDIAELGDEFALYIDQSFVPWSLTTVSDAGHFQALLGDYYLAAGMHSFSIYLTQLALPYTDGEAYIIFGSTTLVKSVPEPSTVLLMLFAFVGLTLLRSRCSKIRT